MNCSRRLPWPSYSFEPLLVKPLPCCPMLSDINMCKGCQEIVSVSGVFTRLTVENFLSLKSVSLELGKVNVLIGPNASGKSNVARAFQLVTNHARRGLPLLEGYKSLVDLSFAFNPVINVRVELEALVNGRRYKYALELKADKYVERILADNEEVLTHEQY